MNKYFKEALEANYLEKAPGPGGKDFIVNGVQYYRAPDEGISLMMKRFSAFGDTLRLHDTLKMDDAAYETAHKTQTDLLKKALLTIVADPEQCMDSIREALAISDRIQQRRRIGLEVSRVYDLASLWYFTEDEDPGEVDTEINRKKVLDWTMADNAAELYGFFLRQPLGQFLPLSALLNIDTLISIQNLNRLELLDLTKLSILKQTLGLMPDTISTIESRREILLGYDGLLEQLLSHTTTL